MNDTQHWQDIVRSLYAGRKTILAMGTLVGMTRRVEELREWGEADPLLLAETIGTGTLPEGVEWFVPDMGPAKDIMEGLRAYDRWLHDPPPEVLAAIERFDPEGEALVMVSFVSTLEQLAGRPRYAPRLPSWWALEDKVNIEAFWDRHGVPRAPSRVVPARSHPLREAHAALDQGLGCAWVGDYKEGFHGGAAYLRWVRTPQQADDAVAFLSAHCDQARVTPFMEGIACSVQGIVFPDYVLAFRPSEMCTLRRPGQDKLLYAGAANFWDPQPEDAAALRALAKQVGAALREEVDYRGGFTIDGVMTAEGFRPTELNTRPGATLGIATHGLGISMIDLCFMVQQGEARDWRPQALEALALEVTRSARQGGGWSVIPVPVEETSRRKLIWENDDFRLAREGELAEGEEPDGSLLLGPSAMGGFLRFRAGPSTPIGPSIGPRLVKAYALADRELGTGLGPLEAARDVRALK